MDTMVIVAVYLAMGSTIDSDDFVVSFHVQPRVGCGEHSHLQIFSS